jgi:hypothetical protein
MSSLWRWWYAWTQSVTIWLYGTWSCHTLPVFIRYWLVNEVLTSLTRQWNVISRDDLPIRGSKLLCEPWASPNMTSYCTRYMNIGHSKEWRSTPKFHVSDPSMSMLSDLLSSKKYLADMSSVSWPFIRKMYPDGKRLENFYNFGHTNLWMLRKWLHILLEISGQS